MYPIYLFCWTDAGPSSNFTTQGKKCDRSSGSASTAAKITPTAQTNKTKSS